MALPSVPSGGIHSAHQYGAAVPPVLGVTTGRGRSVYPAHTAGCPSKMMAPEPPVPSPGGAHAGSPNATTMVTAAMPTAILRNQPARCGALTYGASSVESPTRVYER